MEILHSHEFVDGGPSRQGRFSEAKVKVCLPVRREKKKQGLEIDKANCLNNQGRL